MASGLGGLPFKVAVCMLASIALCAAVAPVTVSVFPPMPAAMVIVLGLLALSVTLSRGAAVVVTLAAAVMVSALPWPASRQSGSCLKEVLNVLRDKGQQQLMSAEDRQPFSTWARDGLMTGMDRWGSNVQRAILMPISCNLQTLV